MADRRKEMINTSGFKVFPSQVEDAVRSMPGVSDVAVVGVPAGAMGECVVAAIVLEAGASVTVEDVRTWAEKSLAHYALPRQIVLMKELPRSQIGKVMRRRVREELLDVQAKVQELGERAQIAVDQAQAKVSSAAAEAAERLRERREPRVSDEGGAEHDPQSTPDSTPCESAQDENSPRCPPTASRKLF